MIFKQVLYRNLIYLSTFIKVFISLSVFKNLFLNIIYLFAFKMNIK